MWIQPGGWCNKGCDLSQTHRATDMVARCSVNPGQPLSFDAVAGHGPWRLWSSLPANPRPAGCWPPHRSHAATHSPGSISQKSLRAASARREGSEAPRGQIASGENIARVRPHASPGRSQATQGSAGWCMGPQPLRAAAALADPVTRPWASQRLLVRFALELPPVARRDFLALQKRCFAACPRGWGVWAS